MRLVTMDNLSLNCPPTKNYENEKFFLIILTTKSLVRPAFLQYRKKKHKMNCPLFASHCTHKHTHSLLSFAIQWKWSFIHKKMLYILSAFGDVCATKIKNRKAPHLLPAQIQLSFIHMYLGKYECFVSSALLVRLLFSSFPFEIRADFFLVIFICSFGICSTQE